MTTQKNGDKERNPRIQLRLNSPQRLELAVDHAHKGEGEFGTWFLWWVIDREQDSKYYKEKRPFFPSQKLHLVLDKISPEVGDIIVVEKKAEENDKGQTYSYFEVNYKGKLYSTLETPPPPEEPDPDVNSSEEEPPFPDAKPKNPLTSKSPAQKEEDYMRLMNLCIESVAEAYKKHLPAMIKAIEDSAKKLGVPVSINVEFASAVNTLFMSLTK